MDIEKTNEERLADSKANLEDLLSWSDELPEQFIVDNRPYYRHKFRGIWSQGVQSSVKFVATILGDDDLMHDANIFADQRRAKGTNQKTTREEINQGNELIRRALRKLQNIS